MPRAQLDRCGRPVIMRTCKDVSRLLSEGLDRDLALGERAAVRVHLFICTACSRVKTQFEFLRRAAAQYPGPEDDQLPPKT